MWNHHRGNSGNEEINSLVYRSLLSVKGRCLVYQTIAVDSFVTSFLQKDIHVRQVDSEFV